MKAMSPEAIAALKQAAKQPEDGLPQTVENHKPLVNHEGKTAAEVWSRIQVDYAITPKEPGGEYKCRKLQPGQAMCVWQRDESTNDWDLVPFVNVSVRTISARVFKGHLITGTEDEQPSSRLSDHPPVVVASSSKTPAPPAKLLAWPGKMRQTALLPGIPALAAFSPDAVLMDDQNMTSVTFSKLVAKSKLVEGNPLNLVVPQEEGVEPPLGASATSMHMNMHTGNIEAFWILPIPQILSAEVDTWLAKDYGHTWKDNVLTYLNVIGATRIYLALDAREDEEPRSRTSERADTTVYRCALSSGKTVGIPLLDHNLLDRMLPFEGEFFDAEIMSCQHGEGAEA